MSINFYELLVKPENIIFEEIVGSERFTIFKNEGSKYAYTSLKTNKNGKKLNGFYYGWQDLEKAKKHLIDAVNDAKSYLQRRKEEREKAKEETKEFLEKIKIGDIFEANWGYEATWYDYYQVVDKKGSFVVLRELKKNCTMDGIKYGYESHGIVSPIKDSFDGEPFKKKVKAGWININSYTSAVLWNGKPKEEANWH